MNTTKTQVEQLATIIDPMAAEFLLADIEDGKSLSGASMSLASGPFGNGAASTAYQRERFLEFRGEHGDLATVSAITRLALTA